MFILIGNGFTTAFTCNLHDARFVMSKHTHGPPVRRFFHPSLSFSTVQHQFGIQFGKMDHATMRKRGWSIQSDPLEGHAEDDLTAEEKKELLNSFPQEHDTTDGHDDGDEHEPESKRQKMDETTTHSDDDDNKKETMLTLAKQKLSKWAARLFDPDRPRGLVQPPQIIPLNDEFLTAFGKREKEYDVKLGRTMEIEQEIQDESSTTSDSLYEDLVVVPDHTKQDSLEGRKVSLFFFVSFLFLKPMQKNQNLCVCVCVCVS
jgi:hypothetical protein